MTDYLNLYEDKRLERLREILRKTIGGTIEWQRESDNRFEATVLKSSFRVLRKENNDLELVVYTVTSDFGSWDRFDKYSGTYDQAADSASTGSSPIEDALDNCSEDKLLQKLWKALLEKHQQFQVKKTNEIIKMLNSLNGELTKTIAKTEK